MNAIQYESKLIGFLKSNQAIYNAVIILFGSFLLSISAQITIPLLPVPVTLQTFAVSLIAMLFGRKMGLSIVLLYLAEGICGLPVFAEFSAGAHILLGPTGGYLLGFIPAVILTGYLLEKGCARNRLTIFIAALLGTIVLFISGYIVLAKFLGLQDAYKYGVVPFFLIEIFKLTFFTIITPFFWKQKFCSHDENL